MTVTNADLQAKLEAQAEQIGQLVRQVGALAPVIPGVAGLQAEAASLWARYRKAVAGTIAGLSAILAFLLSQPWVISNDRLAAILGVASTVVAVIAGLLVKWLPNAPAPGTVVIDQQGNVLAANAVSFPTHPGDPAVIPIDPPVQG